MLLPDITLAFQKKKSNLKTAKVFCLFIQFVDFQPYFALKGDTGQIVSTGAL